jgi:hypothetical protein
MKVVLTLLGLFLATAQWAFGQAPQLEITQINRNSSDTNAVSLQYNLTDGDNDDCEVWLRYSTDGGRSFRNLHGATGDLGYPISPGSGKQVQFSTQTLQNVGAVAVIIRLVASDRKLVDIADLVAQVDSNRMKAMVQQYAIPRHYISQQSSLNAIRDSVEARLQATGLSVYRQPFVFNAVNVANVLARQSGHRRDSSVWIVDAHFDGVANTPGADDNASGVAGMLEIARILTEYEFEESLHYIGFDVEEAGLIGSNRYTTQAISPGDSIKGVFNFEMIGYYSDAPNSQQLPAGFDQLFPSVSAAVVADSSRGNFLTNVGNVNSLPLIALFDTAAARYVPALRVLSLAVPGNGQIAPDLRRSDHAMFWDRGYQALMLTDGANFRNQQYHLPGDSMAILNFEFMTNVVKATLAAAAMAARPMSAGKADISYPFALSLDDAHAHHAHCRMRLVPNPNEGVFEIIIDGCERPFGPADLRIFSLDGREHYHQRLSPALEHRIKPDIKLPKSTYLVVVDNGHEALTEKLLVY